MSDSQLHRFLFDGLPVRGALVQLDESWLEAMRVRAHSGAFPRPVRQLLGQMTAAGFLMQSQLKFKGALLLQIQGDGPLQLAVSEVNSDYGFRATAKLKGVVVDDAGLTELANADGEGRCSITLDPADRAQGTQPYQGVVPLHDDERKPLAEISAVLEHYMLQSEQLDTKLVLAADDNRAAGLLIQRMPVSAKGMHSDYADEDLIGRDEDYNRLAMIAETLTNAELLKLNADDILRRLFAGEALRRFQPEPAHFSCSCSHERVSRMLLGLGREELEDILAEQGQVEVGCDFCGRQYRFDRRAIEQIGGPEGAAITAPGSGRTIH